jgi:hypothetical protein
MFLLFPNGSSADVLLYQINTEPLVVILQGVALKDGDQPDCCLDVVGEAMHEAYVRVAVPRFTEYWGVYCKEVDRASEAS